MNHWKKKLNAFFHDPPHKPLVLGKGHERLGQELFYIYCPQIGWEEVKASDIVASGADRPVIDNREKGRPTQADFLTEPEITHPLALTRIYPAIEPEPDKIHEELKGVLRQLPRESDDFLRHTYLWRVLPEKLVKDSTLGPLWSLLPADTRVPDHTIWQHLGLASAVASSLPKLTFLIFSIGPVQEYISQSRKTQDLWTSSYLLSYLIWEGMKPIVEEFGLDAILYPNLYGQPLVDDWLRSEKGLNAEYIEIRERTMASLPNKFVALLPQDKARAKAEEAKAAVSDCWQKLAKAVKDYLTGEKGMGNSWHSTWHRQTKDFIEAYWVVVPWERNAAAQEQLKEFIEDEVFDNYKDASKVFKKTNVNYSAGGGFFYALNHLRAQQYLDARKRMRLFSYSEELGIKCSICGVREVLHDGTICVDVGKLRKAAKEFWTKLGPEGESHQDSGDRGNERLCAVCTMKRFIGEPSNSALKEIWGGRGIGFPSTSTIAALPFMLEAADYPDLLQDLLEAYKNKDKGKLPRPVLNWESIPALKKVVERMTENQQIREFYSYDGEWIFKESWEQGAPESLEKLLKKAGPGPSRFYAIVLMDGDNMGKLLSGEGVKATWRDVLHSCVPEQMKTFGKETGWDNLLAEKRLMGPAIHSTISKALTEFSTTIVPWVIETEFRGKVIYAGGDDLLAFLPVADALKAADRLRRLYAATFIRFNKRTGPQIMLEDKGVRFYPEDTIFRFLGGASTLSACILFAHHKLPLQPLLYECHRLLDGIAKEQLGRDAFVVSAWKRAGEVFKFASKWERPPLNYTTLVEEISEMLADRSVASGLVYKLRQNEEILKELAELGLEDKKKIIAACITKSRDRRIKERAEEKAEKILALPSKDGKIDTSGLLLAKFLAEEAR